MTACNPIRIAAALSRFLLFYGLVAGLLGPKLKVEAEVDNQEQPPLRFGAIADCQYCDADSPRRKYRLSPAKLQECIADFNSQELSHVVHLGDFIDRDWKSFDVVAPIMDESKAPVRHVLGNHDFSVEDRYKDRVPGRLGLESRYYSFIVGQWRFIVLDSNDVSLYAYPKGSRKYNESLNTYQSLGANLPKYNGGVGETQLNWLENELSDAGRMGQRVILHSHHPVYPPGSHVVWNAEEVISLLEKHESVTAYINGHNHRGAYGFKKGIHYVTLKGMVDTEETAYAVISIYEDRIEVRGKGRQDELLLEIGKP